MDNKKMLIKTFLIVFIFQAISFAADNSEELRQLYENKKYFELRDAVQNSGSEELKDILFYKGIVCNKFNQLEESIGFLDDYLKINKSKAETKLLQDCYEIQANNYVRLSQYQKAVELLGIILDKYESEIDSEDVADYKNSIRLWETFSDIPPQTITLHGATKFKLIKDKAGLKNIPLTIGTESVNFIFDTGANISTITKSCAAKLKFKIFNDSIEVGTVTGKHVYASLGAAPSIKFGNAVIENAVFLVINDEALSVPQIDYQINGIIGFPIIEGLKEITLTKDDSMIIPEKVNKSYNQNMCLDELTPIVKIEHNGKILSLCFDTGARSTYLYLPFYKEYENFVKANSDLDTAEIAGAGGSQKLSVYKLKDFSFTISGKNTSLKDVTVMTQTMNDDSKFFHGNLGQDVINQFGKMTLNFESMSLMFE